LIRLPEGNFTDFEDGDFTGGPLDLIMREVGLPTPELAIGWMEEKGIKPKIEFKPKPKSKQSSILTSAYNYADADGVLQYQVLRYANPRTFKQRAADGTWSIKHLTPIPYRLPEMLAQQNTILIVEGEKDVDNLYELGLTATCNNGGAGNFKDELVPWFTNRTVIIIPDNDEAGQKHAETVAIKLRHVVTSIRIVNLPDLQPKGDVSDWIAAGGTKETLINICKAAPFWEYVEPTENSQEIITAPEIHVDYHSPLALITDKGKPLNHIENLREIVQRLGVVIRYNIIAKEDEILIPGKAFTIDNKANATLAWLVSECSRFQFPTSNIKDFCLYLADQNVYNPVATWVESKPWDGVERLPDLYDTIHPVNYQDNDLKEILLYRWMLSAIAAAFSPTGVAAPGMLVIQGDQYLGKTKWFKSLVPEELGLWKDGMLLRPDNKDSVKQACSFWLVELGELDSTFKKSDISQLKAFITNKSDVLRRAFAVKESHYARRTVFFGSVNPKQFLNDPTGNRRFWTIEASEINHTHGLDMQQIWAEVLHHFRAGESYFLTPNELDLLNKHNEEFTSVDPIVERINSHLAWDDPETLWEWNTATDILISIGIERPTKAEQNTAADAIRKLNGGKKKRTSAGRLMLAPKKAIK